MKMFTVVLLFCVSVASVLCQIPETALGPCPKPSTVKNFEPEKLAGIWYDIKRYNNTVTRGSCGTATYTWNGDSTYTDLYKSLESGVWSTNTLRLTPKDLSNGIFRTNLNGIPYPSDTWILDTDYDNYHIVYSCIKLVPLIMNSQSINIYSRTSTLDEEHLNLALANLNGSKLDVNKLTDVVQDDSVCGRN